VSVEELRQQKTLDGVKADLSQCNATLIVAAENLRQSVSRQAALQKELDLALSGASECRRELHECREGLALHVDDENTLREQLRRCGSECGRLRERVAGLEGKVRQVVDQLRAAQQKESDSIQFAERLLTLWKIRL
jgi:chromosome segregation ATPase